MELVAYLHGEILCERLQQGQSIDQDLDCALLGQAKSIACVVLAATVIGVSTAPIAAIAYSPEIANIQELLTTRGFYSGKLDGMNGAETAQAIEAAQIFYKLEADRVIGSDTIAALQADTYQKTSATDSSNDDPRDPELSSPDILELQNLLAKRGFYNGAIDGVKGSVTTASIVAAQTFYRLKADGVAGAETIAELNADTFQVDTPDPVIANAGGAEVKSDATADLQQLLSDRRFYEGQIDGIYGSRTKAAVIEAQISYGLAPDGVAGSATMAALQSAPVAAGDQQKVAGGDPAADVYSDQVFEGQTLLSDLGLYEGKIDGIQGSRTTAAIRQAQAVYGLPIDGLLGSQTLNALKS
jgi:peptidoglycan hydrolase-like protein with peptidoglycan-binding domain